MSRPTAVTTPAGPSGAAEPLETSTSAVERQKLAQLAAEFESMLVLEMIKTMRQSMLDPEAADDGLGADTFTSTIDTELARSLSTQGGFGLQQYILGAWDRQRGTDVSTQDARPAPGAPVGAPVSIPAGVSAAAYRQFLPHAADASSATSSADRPSYAAASAATSDVAAPDGGASRRDAVPFGLEIAGRVSSTYGWRRDPIHGRAKFHGGIDLAARYGTEVPAAADGTVVSAGEQGGYGLTVVVKHRDGFQTRYAHLSSIDVHEGDAVGKGELLGRVGSTGRSTGPHLHFEVLKGGQRIDPDRFVKNLAGDIKGQ